MKTYLMLMFVGNRCVGGAAIDAVDSDNAHKKLDALGILPAEVDGRAAILMDTVLIALGIKIPEFKNKDAFVAMPSEISDGISLFFPRFNEEPSLQDETVH